VKLAPTIALALALASLGAVPTLAQAAPSDASSSRPWSVQVGMGPMINLESGGALGKFAPDFQYHFKGGDVGPALGGELHMHFARQLFGMNIGPMFLWDFRVYEAGNFKMYLAPLVAMGYAFTTFTPVNATGHAFFMDFGGQLKGMFNDRVGFFIRPINFSMWAGNGGATGFWTLLAGVSISF
jgi:hypothetical protein